MGKNTLIMLAAIIFSGALISVAIIFTKNDGGSVPQKTTVDKKGGQPTSIGPDNVRPITNDDHILGSPAAPIKIIEYSDTECPYCKQFHTVLHQAVDAYEGKVAWVFRHFPLPQIHPKAPREAVATECAAELGGNTSFWAYLDRIYEITPSNNNLDMNLLPEIATYIGLEKNVFQTCLDSGKYDQHVTDDYNNAVESGGRSTPYTIIVTEAGKKISIAGEVSLSSITSVVDKLLSGSL